MVTVESIIRIASYLTKIHHIQGRIRVRVSPKIKDEAKTSGITIEDIKKLPLKIEGIKSIKINIVIGSITIMYDNKIFPYEIWEDLLMGNNLEEISKILTKLEKEVV